MENIEDTVFCLSYELRMLSGLLLEGKTERWVEHCCLPDVHAEHVQRYKLAARSARDKVVLDLACGVGHGTQLLAREGQAATVLGCDVDPEAIRYARIKSGGSNIKFQVEDGLEFLQPQTYDLIVCFETIEHVATPEGLLRNFAASLKPDGQLIISTPISQVEQDLRPTNPYHVQEWGFHSFQSLVSTAMKIEQVFVQFYKLERPPGVVSRAVRRAQRVAGIAASPKPLKVGSPQEAQLKEWNSAGLSTSEYGVSWRGFQILICRRP